MNVSTWYLKIRITKLQKLFLVSDCPAGPKGLIQGLTGEKLPCTQMEPGTCKFGRGWNVLQILIQIILLGDTKTAVSFPFVADKNCNSMSSDHTYEWVSDCQQ